MLKNARKIYDLSGLPSDSENLANQFNCDNIIVMLCRVNQIHVLLNALKILKCTVKGKERDTFTSLYQRTQLLYLMQNT